MFNQSKPAATNNKLLFSTCFLAHIFIVALLRLHVLPNFFPFSERLNDCEGGNFIRTHVKLMSYMSFELTFCLMKWNFRCQSHEFRLNGDDVPTSHPQSVNYFAVQYRFFFSLLRFFDQAQCKTIRVRQHCWKSISLLTHLVWVMKMSWRWEKEIWSVYSTSDILSAHKIICLKLWPVSFERIFYSWKFQWRANCWQYNIAHEQDPMRG